MKKYNKEEIIKVEVTGLQKYGVFVDVDDSHKGLIHISELSYGYIKNIEDYVRIGEWIYAEVLENDEETNKLKLSIKDIDYRNDGSRLKRMPETIRGFEPLRDNLENWITDKIKEVTDKM